MTTETASINPPKPADRDYWETPPSVFDPLNAEFGFGTDICAMKKSRKVRRSWFGLDHPDPARRNSLAADWRSLPGPIWMNPPYSKALMPSFLEKAAFEASRGVTTVGLIPNRTDTSYFHDHVVDAGAEVRFVRGRIRFLWNGVQAKGSPNFGSLVVVWHGV